MDDPPSTKSSDSRSLHDTVSALARAMQPRADGRAVIDAGDQAVLRRYTGGVPTSGAFWRTMLRTFGPDEFERRDDDWLIRWGHVLALIARLARFHRPRERLGSKLGRPAKDASGLDEKRLLRLLRSDGDALADHVRTVSHWIESKGAHVDLTGLAVLLLTTDAEKLEKARRRIAQDYYRSQYQARQGTTS